MAEAQGSASASEEGWYEFSPGLHRFGWPEVGTEALDAGLLSAAQAVEHYEIARYGTLKTWAAQLGLADAVPLLEATLNEEKETDQLLSRLASADVNKKAA